MQRFDELISGIPDCCLWNFIFLKSDPCDICKNLGKSFKKSNSSNRVYGKLNLT